MPRKIFLSFLGTSNYEPVSYHPEGPQPDPLPPTDKYVQKALLQRLATHFSPDDQAVIFLTNEARQANWNDNGHTDFKTNEPIPNTGLQQQIQALNLQFPVKEVDILGESTEEDIWSTFLAVFNCLETDDEVYLDITHSWRYLPMLGMTLLNYAKVTKNIGVKAIYYGAFERLGTNEEVKKLPSDQRPVPILNLVNFSELQDWTSGTHDFLSTGNARRLRESLDALNEKYKNPTFASTVKQLTEFGHDLDAFTQAVAINHIPDSFNRGMHLGGVFKDIKKALKGLPSATPFELLINHIQNKILPIQKAKNSIFSELGFHAQAEIIKNNIEYRQYVQAITIAREAIVSKMCWLLEIPEEERLDTNKRRGKVERWLGYIGYNKEKKSLKNTDADNYVGDIWFKVAGWRNRLNHAFMQPDSDTYFEAIEKVISGCNEAISFLSTPKNVFNKDDFSFGGNIEIKTNEILLNLSNHPSASWSEAQRQAAVEQYGAIRDLPFPQIDPQATADDIDQLSRDYLQRILDIRPAAVHLMGEMTFTHTLVNKLRAAGIPCLASTTRRLVEEKDGQKIVRFDFVAFRPYS